MPFNFRINTLAYYRLVQSCGASGNELRMLLWHPFTCLQSLIQSWECKTQIISPDCTNPVIFPYIMIFDWLKVHVTFPVLISQSWFVFTMTRTTLSLSQLRQATVVNMSLSGEEFSSRDVLENNSKIQKTWPSSTEHTCQNRFKGPFFLTKTARTLSGQEDNDIVAAKKREFPVEFTESSALLPCAADSCEATN